MIPLEDKIPTNLDDCPLVPEGCKHLFRNYQDVDGNNISKDFAEVLICWRKVELLQKVFPEMMDTELAFYLEVAGSSQTDAVTLIAKAKDCPFETKFAIDPYDLWERDLFTGGEIGQTPPVHLRVKLFADLKEAKKKRQEQQNLQMMKEVFCHPNEFKMMCYLRENKDIHDAAIKFLDRRR